MKKFHVFVLSLLTALPAFVYAQQPGGRMALLISYARNVIDSLIFLVVGIALLVFLWGLVKFIFRVGGDEKAVESGKRLMIWGVIALFVMISVWGLVRFIQSELLPGADFASPPLPTVF